MRVRVAESFTYFCTTLDYCATKTWRSLNDVMNTDKLTLFLSSECL